MKGRTIGVLLGVVLVMLLTGCGLTSTPPQSTPTPLSTVRVIAVPTPTIVNPPAAPMLQVIGVDMTVAPAILSDYQCGSYVQVQYKATFHFNEGNGGGVVTFRYTTDNGRSDSPGHFNVGVGETLAVYTFTWSGVLPSDHTAPGLGGVMVVSPTEMQSGTVEPAGQCYA